MCVLQHLSIAAAITRSTCLCVCLLGCLSAGLFVCWGWGGVGVLSFFFFFFFFFFFEYGDTETTETVSGTEIGIVNRWYQGEAEGGVNRFGRK